MDYEDYVAEINALKKEVPEAIEDIEELANYLHSIGEHEKAQRWIEAADLLTDQLEGLRDRPLPRFPIILFEN